MLFIMRAMVFRLWQSIFIMENITSVISALIIPEQSIYTSYQTLNTNWKYICIKCKGTHEHTLKLARAVFRRDLSYRGLPGGFETYTMTPRNSRYPKISPFIPLYTCRKRSKKGIETVALSHNPHLIAWPNQLVKRSLPLFWRSVRARNLAFPK